MSTVAAVLTRKPPPSMNIERREIDALHSRRRCRRVRAIEVRLAGRDHREPLGDGADEPVDLEVGDADGAPDLRDDAPAQVDRIAGGLVVVADERERQRVAGERDVDLLCGLDLRRACRAPSLRRDDALCGRLRSAERGPPASAMTARTRASDIDATRFTRDLLRVTAGTASGRRRCADVYRAQVATCDAIVGATANYSVRRERPRVPWRWAGMLTRRTVSPGADSPMRRTFFFVVALAVRRRHRRDSGVRRIADARPHQGRPARSPSAIATAPRRSRSRSATAASAATASSSARGSPRRSRSSLRSPELKVEWLPVDAVDAPRRGRERQGRRRLRHHDDHAVAHARSSISACRSSSTAAACSCATESKLARHGRSQGQEDRRDRGHDDGAGVDARARPRSMRRPCSCRSRTAPRAWRCSRKARSTATQATGSCSRRCGSARRSRRASRSRQRFLVRALRARRCAATTPTSGSRSTARWSALYRSGDIDAIFQRWLGAPRQARPAAQRDVLPEHPAGVTR